MVLSCAFRFRKHILRLRTLKSSIQNLPSNLFYPFSHRLTVCRHISTVLPKNVRVCSGLSHYFLERVPSSSLSISNQHVHRNSYSKLTNVTDMFVEESEESDEAQKLFPEPRVTLNVLESRLPQKVFDVYYKHNAALLKAGKKKNKAPVKNDWTCSYVFQWPEQRKFESSASTKKEAAETVATSAVAWLYSDGHIDPRGQPVMERQNLERTLSDRLEVTVSDECEEQLRRMLETYEREIKEVYRRTHEAALQREDNTYVDVANDSILEEDDLTDEEYQMENKDIHSELPRRVHPVYGRPISSPTEATLARREERLQRMFRHYDEHRTPLPIDDHIVALTAALDGARALIVAGAAGCGKSTRAPPAALRSQRARAAVLVAEPRRVAAGALAARVAAEMGEEVGETVGYQVRLQARPPRPPGGSVLYCTSGVLLRRLQSNPGLEGCSHVFVDEAHERSVHTDIALLLLKGALARNPELKLVVMSATLDTDVFSRYFDGCPVLQVPGRTYQVEEVYLEDFASRLGLNSLRKTEEGSLLVENRPSVNCAEISEAIVAIDKVEPEGAILVFLPGWAEIKTIQGILEDRFKDSGRHYILPVHSKLSLAQQARIFEHSTPGVRKVALATNVAETSLTVADVSCVLDTGAHRESRARRDGSILQMAWVSRAAARQRAGRAGRTQPGRCYKLYTREKERSFSAHSVPEILRVPLDKVVLDCASYAPGQRAEELLARLPEPPAADAVRRAVDDLVEIGALSGGQRLTALGRAAAALPLPPRAACALLHAAALRCPTAALDAAARLAGAPEPFLDAAERREEIRAIKAGFHPGSDHLALRWLQREYEQAAPAQQERLCDRLGLNRDAMITASALRSLHRRQLARHDAGDAPLERRAEDALAAAALLSGADALLRGRWRVRGAGRVQRTWALFTSAGERAHIAADSVCRGSRAPLLAHGGGAHSLERRALVLRAATAVPPAAALLFCRAAERTDEEEDEWRVIVLPRHMLKIHVPARQADLLMALRSMIWETFQYFIERDLSDEDENSSKAEAFRDELVNVVSKILIEAEDECIARM